MSLDERLFGFFYRKLGAWRKRALDPALSPTAVALSDASPRLSVLASAVAGTRLEVLEAEAAGGVYPPRLHLPRILDLGRGAEASVRGYVLRTVLDAALAGVGPSLSSSYGPASEQLLSLLLLPRALLYLDADFPAARSLYESLAPHALELRKPWREVPTEKRRLEALARVRLGLAAEPLSSSLTTDEQAWLTCALTHDAAPMFDWRSAWNELGTAKLQPADPVPLFGAFGCCTQGQARAAVDPRDPTAPQKTERTMRTRERVQHIALNGEPAAENPIVHSFEKLHTAEEYRGGNKRADGEDELDQHAEALDELDLHEVTRSGESAQSIYRADLLVETELESAAPLATEPEAFVYDEWDDKKQTYRRAWCHLYEERLSPPAEATLSVSYVRDVARRRSREIHALRSEVLRLRMARSWHKRQPDGPDIDVDAVIERYASLRAEASTADERLYVARRKRAPDVAVTVLVDGSASSDSWVLGQRVIDVARESLVVLGEALCDQEFAVAMAAFSSQTRSRCRFEWVKRFEEPFAAAGPRIVGLRPEGYTRIGPVLRHATRLLEGRPETKKLLILLSDGKATDYDQYEGRHGISDVRKAVSEAEGAGVHVLALAIDRTCRAHLPAMFGRGRFEVLPRPELLARALTQTCASLLRT